jgi:hypothetical protein
VNVITGPGRFAGEVRVAFTDATGARAHGLWSAGHGGVRPWVDLHDADPGLLVQIARLLGPGGSIMVAYGVGETEQALRRKVPPAATPLGLALLRSGCRWMKDWYFAEGGREGHAKLQGELPMNEHARTRAEAALSAELIGFLAAGRGSEGDRRAVREALAIIE